MTVSTIFPCSPLLAQVLETQLLFRVSLYASVGYLSSPIVKFAAILEHIIVPVKQ